MASMNAAEATQISQAVDKLASRIDLMDERIKALPDKGGVYSAAFAVHALVWAAIFSTLTVTINLLNVFGAFKF
ncbi:hypothetical protein [Phyllobacterium sp. K27]